MSYAIGHIVLGTWLPAEADAEVAKAYVRDDPTAFLRGGEILDDLAEFAEGLLAEAEDGDLDWLETFRDNPWVQEYSAGDEVIAWVGAELKEFDETENFPLADLTVTPTGEQVAEPTARYHQLPASVRALLPPFGTYVVWSSS